MKPEAHVAPAAYAAEHPVLQNPGETRTLDHLPQLDGIRAIAVGMVVWSHFMPRDLTFRGNPPWGAMGVGLFFTLSGFLITRILLNARLKMVDKKASLGGMLKQFYVRRFLRIFPLYYAILGILAVLNVTNFRERFWYSFLYLTNYRFSYDRPVYLDNVFREKILGWEPAVWKAVRWPQEGTGAIERHLWSLSVEEQFYIFWPFLILLCPRKLLLPMMLLTVAGGVVWRTYNYVPKLQQHEWMTPGCLDLLGMGAILAILSLPRFNLARWRDGFVQLCGLVGVPMIIAFVAQRWWPTVMAKGVPTAVSYDWMDYGGATYPITALTAVWLIGTAARGFKGPIGWFLTCPPVVYIGRISYGLYVIHMLVPHLMVHLFPASFGGTRGWHHLVWYTLISVALASVSWFALEAPMNKLKRYFEYDRTASTKAATPAVSA